MYGQLASDNVSREQYNALYQELQTNHRRYQEALGNQHNQHIQEINKLQQRNENLVRHCADIEGRYKDIKSKYNKIIPEILSSDGSRASPSVYLKNKVFVTMKALLFGHHEYVYSCDDTLDLFDDILNYLNPDFIFKISDCMYSMKAIYAFLHGLGTGKGANRLKLQHLQIATASVMYIENNKLMNKDLIKLITPQQSRQCINSFVTGCFSRRLLFDRKQSKIVCKEYKDETRSSRMNTYVFPHFFVCNMTVHRAFIAAQTKYI